MGKPLGIIGLVIGCTAIVVPFLGLFVAWVALLVAAVAAVAGDRAFSSSTVVVSGINIFLFSPSALVLFAAEGTHLLLLVTLGLLATPLAIALLPALTCRLLIRAEGRTGQLVAFGSPIAIVGLIVSAGSGMYRPMRSAAVFATPTPIAPAVTPVSFSSATPRPVTYATQPVAPVPADVPPPQVLEPPTVASIPPVQRFFGDDRVEPTFDCRKADTDVARAICRNVEAAFADWRMVGAYMPAFFSLREAERAAFKREHTKWLGGLAAYCRSQTAGSGDQQFDDCIAQNYQLRANSYRSRLTGPAWEEALLASDQLKRIQRSLQARGLLSASGDGVFGSATREAIRRFQLSRGETPTDFLTADQRQALGQ